MKSCATFEVPLTSPMAKVGANIDNKTRWLALEFAIQTPGRMRNATTMKRCVWKIESRGQVILLQLEEETCRGFLRSGAAFGP